MPISVGLCWAITMVAAGIAALVLLLTIGSASGAPQEAAGAAMAVAICVIPYVFTRACQAFAEMGRQREMLAAIEAIRDGNPRKG